MKKKYISLFLRLVISIGLIAYFINMLAQKPGGVSEGLQQFTKAFSDAPLQWLIAAGLLHIVGLSLLSLRWKVLLRGQDVHRNEPLVKSSGSLLILGGTRISAGQSSPQGAYSTL